MDSLRGLLLKFLQFKSAKGHTQIILRYVDIKALGKKKKKVLI